MIFVVDGNCLSIHTDNRKNNFLVMGERPTDDINDNVGTAEKEIGINFAKADLSLYYNSGESYLYMHKGRVMACLQSRAGYSGRDGGGFWGGVGGGPPGLGRKGGLVSIFSCFLAAIGKV